MRPIHDAHPRAIVCGHYRVMICFRQKVRRGPALNPDGMGRRRPRIRDRSRPTPPRVGCRRGDTSGVNGCEPSGSDGHQLWCGGDIPIGVGDMSVADVRGEREDVALDVGIVLVPMLKPLGNEGMS
jgi:hypothetical protein